MSVLIVSIADDLHALSLQAALRNRGVECHILESDHVTGVEALSFGIGNNTICHGSVRSSEGRTVDVSKLKLIWWRRGKAPQKLQVTNLTDHHLGLINNDCAGTVYGLLQNVFKGKWISCPLATEAASNKLNQLVIAQHCGLRIPDTLVSQSPKEVEEFFKKHNKHVIVKPVAGTPGPLLFTQLITRKHLRSRGSIRASPAIYQEFISGTRHIRLNCFGETSFAASIDSPHVDWRPDLNVPISAWPVPKALHKRIRRILDSLSLEMGIVDPKEDSSGEIVWLEVNPQGQFLFLEGLTGMPLTQYFADFLCRRIEKSRESALPRKFTSTFMHEE
jgi:glutathione synthase/RimK-type ligase-like ATP-grasp enzyme